MSTIRERRNLVVDDVGLGNPTRSLEFCKSKGDGLRIHVVYSDSAEGADTIFVLPTEAWAALVEYLAKEMPA